MFKKTVTALRIGMRSSSKRWPLTNGLNDMYSFFIECIDSVVHRPPLDPPPTSAPSTTIVHLLTDSSSSPNVQL
ncbi:hypothetical protein L596_005916 [Steinernema carpocapsae]|uniref:Uncharacterized protein n=1 Tax=Steinernema carpocapsae TaxID=34508 RepID=A0A4U8V0M3_STECR|nr:hypothetical protein L596_005916 [Steinernema carpocapsae]